MNIIQKITSAIFILFILSSLCVKCTKMDGSEITEQTETIVGENTYQTEDIEDIEDTTEMTNTNTNTEETKATEETIEESTEESTEEIVETIMYFSEKDVIALAKVLYNECRGVPSDMEKACVAWVACNRVDAGYGDSIYEVVTAPHQFAYGKNTRVTEELYNLALDVLTRWNDEKNGFENVGRVLPSDYLWFYGDGKHNHFRNAFSGSFDIWDYSLSNPYND